GARALPPGDLPRGNGRGRPAAGVGGAACGAAGDQRRQAAAIPAAPLPPGGGGAGNGGPAGPRLQRGCFSGGHRHGGSGSEADRPAAGGAPAQAGGGRGGHCGERPGAGHPADLRGPADSGDRSGERGGAAAYRRDHCLLRGMGP
ncbi:dUTP diphosphatase, partial [Dysosmobacter welbionis]